MKMNNYLIQLYEAERHRQQFVAALVKAAEERGAKVTILDDEVIIEEPTSENT